MAVNPFIRALSLSHFEDFASAQGLSPTEMLRRASLPVDLLHHQEGILSYRRFCTLLDICAQEAKMPLFGLHQGLHQGASIFGPLLYLIRNAGTVGDALAELAQNYSLQNGAAEVSFEVDNGMAVLSYHVSESTLRGITQAEELAIGVSIRLMRSLIGGDWQPAAALLRHAPLTDLAAYRRALGFQPTFGANCTGLQFESKILSRALDQTDEMLHGVIAKHLERMERLTADELPNCMRQLLRNMLPSGRVTIEKVAECMAINPRTLQRRLAQEGTAFQDLLDDTRKSLALQYLEDATINITQIAVLLGYADLTAFCRAFQRWFGSSPREWRKQRQPGLQPRLLRGKSLRSLR